MPRISASMLHIESFLCFIRLRGGTLFSLYFTIIFDFFVLLSAVSGILIIIIEGILIIEMFISGCALLYFPEMNKKYAEDSVNAKCIKFFSIQEGVMVILCWISLGFSIIYFGGADPFAIYFTTFMEILGIGVHLHFTAVAYSFYLSIIQPDSNYQQGDLISNIVYNDARERND